MPKKKVKPPRSDGRYEYKAEIGRKFDGKPIRKAFYSYESLADAKQQAEDYKINKKAAELNGSVTDIIKIIGFKDFCLKYIEKYVEGSVEDNTSYETKCRAEKHLIPYFNNILLRQLTNEDIQDFFISKNIIDLSSAVKIKLKQFLKCMFEKAVELKYCTTNPAAKIKLGKYKTVVKKEVYSEDEMRLFIDFAIKEKAYSIFTLFKTGVREGELLAFEDTDISFNDHYFDVNKALKERRGNAEEGDPKSDAGWRKIPVDDETINIAKEIPKTVSFTRKKKPVTVVCEKLFPNKYGEAFSPKNWRERVYKPFVLKAIEYYAGKGISLKYLNPHEVRHSYGTMLYNKGIDLRTIMRVMGHSSIEVTAKIYIHDNIDTMKKTMEKAFKA